VTALVNSAALLVAGAAIVAAALVLARTRSLRQAVAVLLDLLTAAGLLRLAAAPTWPGLGVTVVVIVLRRLVGAGVRSAATSAVRPGLARRHPAS
jgi:hypothetical protein